MHHIVLVEIGRVDEEILYYLRERLEDYLPVKVSFQHLDFKRIKNCFDGRRGQYFSPMVLDVLIRLAFTLRSVDRVVGLADVDAYSDALNFVFGEALLNGPAAIVYLKRLNPEFYGEEFDEELFLERVFKEGLHELGHTYGLTHCRNYCVMMFSNSIIDTDYKPPQYCESCYERVLARISMR